METHGLTAGELATRGVLAEIVDPGVSLEDEARATQRECAALAARLATRDVQSEAGADIAHGLAWADADLAAAEREHNEETGATPGAV